MRLSRILLGAAACVLAICRNLSLAADSEAFSILTYYGASDASAAVALSATRFVMADDEENVLKVYDLAKTDGPVDRCDLSAFLDVTEKDPEVDIEGATRVGNRIYWISSHGRSRTGKPRPNRYRFFATDVVGEGEAASVRPVGRYSAAFLEQMLAERWAAPLGLERATRLREEDMSKKDRERLAPKDEGLNIEALAASADSQTLYIGFRNPRPTAPDSSRPRALVVPLLNAQAIVESGAAARLGEPMLWDLGGMGLRDMTYWPERGAYFLIAGPHGGDQTTSLLWRWSGDANQQPTRVCDLIANEATLTPEALVSFPGGNRLLALSDDGTVLVDVASQAECMEGEWIEGGKCPNKFLLDPAKKHFRAFWIEP